MTAVPTSTTLDLL